MKRLPTYALVFASGLAALSWEVLWQIRASLAIGVSAMGTAITLAATMGGITLGALAMGRVLARRVTLGQRPLQIYAALEIVIGLAGVAVFLPGFSLLERVDGAIFLRAPTAAMLAQLVGIFLVVGLPTIAMGATVPVFGLMARASRTSIASLYGVNTAGAAMGVLAVTFGLMPRLGVELTAVVMTCVNLIVALGAWLLRGDASELAPGEPGELDALDAPDERAPGAPAELPIPSERAAALLAFLTGFVSFALEVAWFRTLRASYRSTTDAFAIMLVSVLVPLAFGAKLGSWLRARGTRMSSVLAAAGAAVLVVTPVIERFDALGSRQFRSVWTMCLTWLGGSLPVLGLPMLLLGSCLPWLLESVPRGATRGRPATWGRLYAMNTMGAVTGSLVAAWLLLPRLGFARTAWLLGVVVVVASLFVPSFQMSWRRVAPGALALVVAVLAESGAGRTRIIGNFSVPLARIVSFEEGVDATLAVADNSSGQRLLFIDGFVATDETAAAHYMAWMGRLPMIAHGAPRRALVICFGTGQTANGVRRENPESLDVVELSPAVLRSAPLFTKNEGVLDDPRVHATVMDGRAWLRRTDHVYDVVTLEPMPPNFAGVNALYSREFYELVASRLAEGGVATQWIPYHLLSVHDAVAIVATFQSVFADSLVWVDPVVQTGIIVGRRSVSGQEMGRTWPGLERPSVGRDLDAVSVHRAVALRPADVVRLAELGEIITDDNQLLSYGPSRYRLSFAPVDLSDAHLTLMTRVREQGAQHAK